MELQQTQPQTHFTNRQPIQRAKPNRREIVIDYFRGFAIGLMIITHVIGLTFAGDNKLVNDIGEIGGIASFTMFLFISGVSAYFSFLKYDNNENEKIANKKHTTFWRVVKIILLYYVLATASIFVLQSLYSFPPSTQWIEIITKTLFFQIVPEYTEFLITLAFFALSLIFLRRFYKFLVKNPIIGIFVMIGFYSLGSFLFTVNFGIEELNAFKALFAGHEISGQNTFPIFQYFPIYMLGIYFGDFWFENQDNFRRLKITFIWLIVAAGFTIQATISYSTLGNDIFATLARDGGRFPAPTPGFLSISMAIALLALVLIMLFVQVLPKFLRALLHYMGTNPIDFLFFHTLFLLGYRYLTSSEFQPNGQQHETLMDVIIMYTIIVIGSLLLTTFKNRFKEWTLEDTNGNIWWLFSERAVSSVVMVIIISFAGSTLYKDVLASESLADSTDIQFKKRLIREEEWPKWWDNQFTAFRQIVIDNQSNKSIYKNEWVAISFNHAEAVAAGDSYSTEGNDVRIVFYDNLQGEFKELPILIDKPNSENTEVSFKVQNEIKPGDVIDTYFLYYGNEFLSSYPKSADTPNNEPKTGNIELLAETKHSVLGDVNKKWYLKEKETAYAAPSLIFEVELINDSIGDNPVVTYTVPGTDIFGKMKQNGDNFYKTSVAVSELDPGIYTIQANITEISEDIKVFRSQKIPFYVSYPIYVTWTQDWEGWDVEEYNLEVIDRIANQYQMPMTHFFNPRIFVEEDRQGGAPENISKDRALYLTNWVKNRQKEHFDEIGMHIHMWTDIVREAGVTPKYTYIQGTYGIDVATYQYSKEEIKKVINWGRTKFGENDLNPPISYRAGAWMVQPHVLQALEETGFLLDSSGRTGGPVNPSLSNSTPVPWSLSPTTYPYLPSVNDINSWEGERLSIWEFPNNGADSYWFSAAELISRFDQNYPDKGSIVERPQVVTYLSHPHWFWKIDQGRIEQLLTYTGQFLNRDDRGPVVYATLEQIYREWDKVKFINGD